MIWTPLCISEVQNAPISMAAYKTMMIPLAGSVGYIGAALTGVLPGWLTDVLSWGTSFFAGLLILLLWNYKPEKGEYE
jgi:sugar phosphate permease